MKLNLRTLTTITILVTVVLVAARLNAQSYNNQYGFRIFYTPEDASTSLSTLSSAQSDRASVVPVQTFQNSYPYNQTVSWILQYPVTDDDTLSSCKQDSSGAVPPVQWTSNGTCQYGMSGWSVSAFSTMSDARTFYNALNSDQRKSAFLLTPIGSQRPSARFLVVYLSGYSSFCM